MLTEKMYKKPVSDFFLEQLIGHSCFSDKSYIREEEDKRQIIWQNNYRKILKHNYEYDLGTKSYRLGLNRFADMVRILESFYY